MKILEVTAFSAGICGVWTRVLAEAQMLSKRDNEVYVFSSDIFRGTDKIKTAPSQETIGDVKIIRFPAKASFGQNTFFWNYENQALKLKPDIIITHAYRQYYSTKALRIAKKLKIPCILVTHAPFLDKKLRNWKLNLAIWFYDTFIGKRILNKYSKIFAITNWEIPYLLKLGAKKNKIVYVPNGIPEEFFKKKIENSKNKLKKLLFLGRIAPIKDIETLIKAFKITIEKNKNITLELVGPIEENYKKQIVNLINNLNLINKIKFLGPIYDLKKKINLIDEHEIFVLPSKREGMPQALIEAMAREKIIISSTTDGGKEIIKDTSNGYLFEIGNYKQLAELILKSLENNKQNQKIKKQARKSVERFSWSKLIEKIEKIYNIKNY